MARIVNKAFTGLRGMACFCVVIAHFGTPLSIIYGAFQAVVFFFVLSGYLLYKSCLEQILKDPNRSPQRFHSMLLSKYLIRRFFRIFPAFVIAIAIYKLEYLTAWGKKYIDLTAKEWVQSFWSLIFLEPTSTHLWTIRVECAFYFLMLPITLTILSEVMIFEYKYLKGKCIKIVPIIYVLFTGISIWLSFKVGYQHNLMGPTMTYGMYINIPVFWYGCLFGSIAYYWRYLRLPIPKLESKFSKIILEVITYLIMIRIIFSNSRVAVNYMIIIDGIEPIWNSQLLVAPFYGLLLLILDLTDSKCSIGRFFSLSLIYKLGEISYSTYLIHLLAQHFMVANVFNIYIKDFEFYVAQLFVAHLLGLILYVCVEDKGVKLGNLIIKKMSSIGPHIVDKENRPLKESVKDLPDSDVEEVNIRITK
jgi:peptidoglycan/LPS O-acetylase OafA/YrhL